MTDSQQNCFLAVTEYRSFSRAADALYVSQPAVSKNISALEAELGAPLFDRQGRYVTLTQAGEILHKFLMEYRRELENTKDRIKALDWGMPTGTVRIGCGMSWNAAHFYSRLARHFSIHYPGIQLEVEGMEPDTFLTALRRKEVDAVIMYGLDFDKQTDVELHRLTNIGTGFLCSSMLTKNYDGQLSSLACHPFLVAENPTEHRYSNVYRRIINGVCSRCGFVPEYRICRTVSSGLVDLSCGKGLLLADDWTAAINNSEYSYIPTGDTVAIYLAHLSTPADSPLSLFISETVKVFEGNL